MNLLRLLPVILSYGLLAAHFSRADLFPLVMVSLAIILITVALCTASSTQVIRGKSLKKRYQLEKQDR
jgi:hypothetical protein